MRGKGVEMISYEIPDFTQGLGLNLFFARVMAAHPDWAQPDVTIAEIYGNFPDCPLNGGRTYIQPRWSAERIEWTFSVLDEYGIKPRLTFTNMFADLNSLKDPYVHTILEAASRHHGQVIVYADEIGDYIRSTYHMPIILSTTRALSGVDELNRMLDHYDWVVLDYNHNKDDSFLRKVAHPEKLEVMVNEFCMPHCPYRQEHYKHNSLNQLQGTIEPFACRANRPDFFDHKPGHPTQFTCEEVQEIHQRYGISAFKIVGRGTVFQTQVESLCYYLIRPEYRDNVRNLLAQEMNHAPQARA